MAMYFFSKKKCKKRIGEEQLKGNTHIEQLQEEAHNKRQSELVLQFTLAQNKYLRLFYSADRNVLIHFCSKNNSWFSLENTISGMQQAQHDMDTSYDVLAKEYGQNAIARLPSRSNLPPVESIKQLLSELRLFEDKCRNTILSSNMIREATYGHVDKEYITAVKNIGRSEAVSFINQCRKFLAGITIAPMFKQELVSSTGSFFIPPLDDSSFDEEAATFEIDKRRQQISALFNIDIEKIIKCIWFFALETPFSVQDYQNAKEIFLHIFRREYCDDIIIADLYSRFNLGGEEAIQEKIKQLLEKYPRDSHLLTLIASSLMWMKAYQCENAILQHMLFNSLNMSMACQQRLHALTNSGGKTTECLDVPITSNELYFDISSLAWKDDDYSRLFDTLVFRGKTLTYSLAIRDEDKELTIPNGVSVPSTEQIQDKFKTVFAEEYGDSVTCRIANSIAISGSSEEKLKGILISSTDCTQMGILIYLTKIGKKLTIKLYTLFLPTGNDLTVQKQQILSLYNKLSPSTTSWESSLKETMLEAVQQCLNEGVQTHNYSNNTSENGPVF